MIKDARFVKSSQNLEQCPEANYPEYAFIGRSNVGKSSLINMLANDKKLAKTSSTPGKTQLINHFLIDQTWYLVDLPGYGWAQVGQKMREEWEKHINNYLIGRETLQCIFVLIDIRHEPQKNDLQMMEWLAKNGLPFAIIFTKSDKLTKNATHSSLSRYRKQMLRIWEEMPQYFVTSSQHKLGKEEILAFVDELNENFVQQKGY